MDIAMGQRGMYLAVSVNPSNSLILASMILLHSRWTNKVEIEMGCSSGWFDTILCISFAIQSK
jgi:hypothetical protein